MKSLTKKFGIFAFTALMFASMSGCGHAILVNSRTAPSNKSALKKRPPGHAKKAAGHKSARAFAPGQRKK